jgi:hypothetical protein
MLLPRVHLVDQHRPRGLAQHVLFVITLIFSATGIRAAFAVRATLVGSCSTR